ncbi:MAG TPA: AcvB/VirJ family lysyl-phosphatidylglycerol hydrolase [Vicinamibacterales bacterium]|nr:AcvB/VirJ family lysyl-phosphatidylglycerol hydrolase [Vicinamibacterales bacterium]
MLRPLGLLVAFVAVAAPALAAETLDVPLRGKTLSLAIYRPSIAPKGTIVMASGDVGWVGLAVSMAQQLNADGYVVAGVNVRQYLSAFAEGKSHLTEADVRRDYGAIADRLRQQNLLASPVILSGVSEGAAISALAASDPANHTWIDGVIAMGLPEVAELAWHWSDVTAWIFKRDANEPSFHAHEIIASVSPVPLVLIQSTKDEYVSEADYRRLFETAREPKRLMLIEASNHRFTDKPRELRAAYASALDWVRAARGSQGTVK